jgi:hypothetical protein
VCEGGVPWGVRGGVPWGVRGWGPMGCEGVGSHGAHWLKAIGEHEGDSTLSPWLDYTAVQQHLRSLRQIEQGT